jgi:hypothetical protein
MDMDRDDGADQGGKEEEGANRGNKGAQVDGSQKLNYAMDISDVGNAKGSGGRQNKKYMINTSILPDHIDSMDRAVDMEGTQQTLR